MTSARSVETARRPAWRRPRQWWLWAQGLVGSRYDGLAHFGVVEPGVLLRSGQPRIRDLERIRDEHGLGAIVAARGGVRHPLRGRWFRRERAFCEQHGIRFIHMPFSDAGTPPADVFERFLSIVRDPDARPVLVHCEQGWHRTGILCAAYRVAECGWSLDDAADEMESYGYETENPKRRPLVEALRAWSAGHAVTP